MNYTLQIHGERAFYQVPPGLYELMSDISREVLRDQPEQVYKYIAGYMDTLLKLRSNMKKALEVVDDVIAENKELFAYVDQRGMTWDEANRHARVIQRAYRRARARKELKERVRMANEEKLGRSPIAEHSPSFIEYFESLGIDYETANKASLTIQTAFKTFKARKQMESMVKSSTHTIDMIAPPVEIPLVLEKPTTRNSKLQVYEESPSPSVNSGWYKPLPDEPVGTVREQRSVASSTTSVLGRRKPFTRDSKLQVYEQSPSPSVDTAWYATQRRSTDVSMEARRLGLTKGMSFLERDDISAKPSRTSPSPTLEGRIPTYFDLDQSKVPMISESGQLQVLEEDVVTLFSTDTIKVEKSFIGSAGSSHSQKERDDKLPSLKDLGKKPSKTDSETAKELFSIIEKKPSEKSRSLAGSLRLASEDEKKSVVPRVSSTSRSIILGGSHKSVDEEKVAARSSQTSRERVGASLRPRSSSRMMKMGLQLSSEEEESALGES